MNRIEKFYPVSKTIVTMPDGMWQVGATLRIRDHLKNAKSGIKESETRLCNKLGTIRRSIGYSFKSISPDLLTAIKESSDWLRTTGRNVDFASDDPRKWITARDGVSPRF